MLTACSQDLVVPELGIKCCRPSGLLEDDDVAIGTLVKYYIKFNRKSRETDWINVKRGIPES
jgi:hypothetical protein